MQQITIEPVPTDEWNVKSHEDIYQQALQEWIDILSQLWTAFGKPVDADQMIIYQRSLSVLPLGLLDAAVQRVIREHEFNNIPTVAEVWKAVRKELGNPVNLDRAVQSWCDQLWSKAVLLRSEIEEVETEE